ncbi:MAG: AAA family ATPase [Oscillospiraceae bacterium]|nr:AAA family ATPase [Oscillospiraceae bacterium]
MLLQLKNIGPHDNLSMNFSSNHSIIYAKNASGKSFIARSLNAINNYQNPELMKVLISIGSDSGTVNIDNTTVCINSNGKANRTHEPDYKIVVFDEKYTDENLKTTGFHPNGNIEGIILGKTNIDIQSDRYKLLGLKVAGVELKEKISAEIDKRKKELKKYDISASLGDYKAITFEYIEHLSHSEQKYLDFDSLTTEYLNLKNYTDISVNVPTLTLNAVFDANALNSILKTAFTKSNFTDEFKAKISTQRNFIQEGLAISNGKFCPFCGQEFSNTAVNLIDAYNKYLNDSENKVKTQLNSISQQLTKLSDDIINLYNVRYPDIANQVMLACANMNKSKRVLLQKLPDVDLLIKCIDSIQAIISVKCESIDCNNLEVDDIFLTFNTQLSKLNKTIQQINYQIGTVNTNANNISKEKTRLKKEICKALQADLSRNLKNDFATLQKLRNEYKEFYTEIQQKEAIAKVSKKALVADTFSQLIEYFFDEKYIFDKSTFSLVFKNNVLNDSAIHILSDGEKSIIALLFFIANIHSSVNSIDDYGNMLVVIDDPSSNLDYENTIRIADIISDINSIVDVSQDIKTIVLTHDTVLRDEIIKQQNATLLTI